MSGLVNLLYTYMQGKPSLVLDSWGVEVVTEFSQQTAGMHIQLIQTLYASPGIVHYGSYIMQTVVTFPYAPKSDSMASPTSRNPHFSYKPCPADEASSHANTPLRLASSSPALTRAVPTPLPWDFGRTAIAWRTR